jgi:hypothetical protein
LRLTALGSHSEGYRGKGLNSDPAAEDEDPEFDEAYRKERRSVFRQLQQGATTAATALLKIM